jgi:hypothetical protein
MIHLLVASALALALSLGVGAHHGGAHASNLDCTNCVYSGGGPPG